MVLAIYGPGGYGREVASFARRQGEVVFVSDSEEEIGVRINDVAVISFAQLVEKGMAVCVAVADATVRRRLVTKCEEAGVRIGHAWADTSLRGDNVHVGAGAILSDFTLCTADLTIGQHLQANIYSYIAHDCVIGNFVTLAPRVCVNGNTIIEDDVYVGTGAILRQGTPDKPLRIGRGAVIGMGAVVTKDVAPGVTVIGNPARPLDRS
jgi:sugar O-acyltransferase (sialic acid O-acetyltransferase NeuD family)